MTRLDCPIQSYFVVLEKFNKVINKNLLLSFLNFLLLILISCSENTNQGNIKIERPEVKTKEQVIKEYALKKLSSSQEEILKIANKLDSIYGHVPYYFQLEGKMYFITALGNFSYETENKFDNTIRYGIVTQDNQEILSPIYTKIYNPCVTVLGCLELEKSGKIGLIDLKSKIILEPKYDFIIPSSTQTSELAYGKIKESWFEILRTSNGFREIATTEKYQLYDDLMEYDIKNYTGRYFNRVEALRSTTYGDPTEGDFVFMTPSYLDALGVLPEACVDYITNGGFGTEKLKLEVNNRKSLSNGLISFLISVYKKSVDARGYWSTTNSAVTLNPNTNSINNRIFLTKTSNHPYICEESSFNVINDSLIEVRELKENQGKYDFETTIQHFLIDQKGKISLLKSNRYFSFTQFIKITPSYFKGCFASYLENDNYSIMIQQDHLSIEDLELMKNEIYADYGFIFISKKWSTYFSKQVWYHAKYNNVDFLLSDIDKHNIEVIVERLSEMKKDEKKYTNKRKVKYTPAG